jgi:hypothetical protein
VGVGYGGSVGVGVGEDDGIGHQNPQHGGCVGTGVTTGHHTPGFGTQGVGSGVGVGVGVGVGSSHNEHCNPIDVSTQTGQPSLNIVMFVHVPAVSITVSIPLGGVQ